MIQTFSFPRKRAISELSTSLQLPTQTIFTQCKWCAVRVHQQPRGLHLAVQPKRFLNTEEGSQTQRSFCERKDDGNRGSRHKPNSPGAGGAGSVLFSSFFCQGLLLWVPSTLSNVRFKGRLHFCKHLAVSASLCSSLAQDTVFSFQ